MVFLLLHMYGVIIKLCRQLPSIQASGENSTETLPKSSTIEAPLSPFRFRDKNNNLSIVFINRPSSVVVSKIGVVWILEESKRYFCLHRFMRKL
jgi:hypothetical protein